MSSIPTWLVPVIEQLQQYAKDNPNIVGNGTFEVIEKLSDEELLAIGICYEPGKFHDVSFRVNRKLNPGDCQDKWGTVVWRIKGQSSDAIMRWHKAFRQAPDRSTEIAEFIWARYVQLNKDKVGCHLYLVK
jgi:hypothetical protein